MAHHPNDYALVVGVQHYPYWANGKNELHGAIEDARSFHAWLTSQKGGGLAPENALLLTSREQPVTPLKHIIDEHLRQIREMSKRVHRRRFYFYFSGHGHSPAGSKDQQCLCLANWSTEDAGAALNLESYINTAMGCMNFEEGLFFLDCCRVRKVAPLGQPSELECGDPKFDDKHYFVFYAAEHYTAGFESIQADPQLARGFFTKALMNILGKGRIEAADLAQRLYEEVPVIARPRNQVARSKRNADRKLYLGIDEPPPVADLLDAAPTSELSVTLETHLNSEPSGTEPPLPPPGDIRVYSGSVLVASARGSLVRRLPLGSYEIRVLHGEAVELYTVHLAGDTALSYPLPRRASAAPLSSTKDKHETITDPIVATSSSSVWPGETILVAHRNRRGLVSAEGRLTLVADGDANWAPHVLENTGPIALYAAEPGNYTLIDRVSNWSLNFPVAKDWDTQIFVGHDGQDPLLDRASIHMQRAGRGFNPSDALIDAYELALADLATGGPGPDDQTLDYLLEGKFDNPLFGLVAAHFLIRRINETGQIAAREIHLLETVLGNMSRLLGDSNPDVIALRVLSLRWTSLELPALQVAAAPMLRASAQALISATVEMPKFLPVWFDRIALAMDTSSPWVCWRAEHQGTLVSPERVRNGVRRIDFEMKWSPRLKVLRRIFEEGGYSVRETLARRRGYRHIAVEVDSLDESLNRESLTRLIETPDWVVAAMKTEIQHSAVTGRTENYGKLVRRLLLPLGLLEQAARIARMEMSDSDTTNQHMSAASPRQSSASG